MLERITDRQGFEMVATEDNAFLADIDDFELIFFMNPTGYVFTDQEQKIFEAWMGRGRRLRRRTLRDRC